MVITLEENQPFYLIFNERRLVEELFDPYNSVGSLKGGLFGFQ